MSRISSIPTFADLLHRLGDIPPDRIRLVPPPGTATKRDLVRPENTLCELVDGTLVEKTVGVEESFLAMFLSMRLNEWIVKHNLGFVTGESGIYELPSGSFRGPDIAFTAWSGLNGRKRPEDPYPLLAPDLVVEVFSRSNSKREMEIKREEYFRGGVRLLWEIDPRKRSFRVYTSLGEFHDLEPDGTIRGEPVLPGFELKLADLFAELDRRG